MITILNRDELGESKVNPFTARLDEALNAVEGFSFACVAQDVNVNERTRARNLALYAGARIKTRIESLVKSSDVRVRVDLTSGKLHNKTIFSCYSAIDVGGMKIKLGVVRRV